MFEAILTYAAFTMLRVIGIPWPTSRRIGGMPLGCAFGCDIAGGDDLRKYASCLVLRACALGGCARAPCWGHEGHFNFDVLAAPLAREHMVVSGMWAYIAYSLFPVSHGLLRPYNAGEFAATARAATRSLCSRAPVAHTALCSGFAQEATVVPRGWEATDRRSLKPLGFPSVPGSDRGSAEFARPPCARCAWCAQGKVERHTQDEHGPMRKHDTHKSRRVHAAQHRRP